jgi:hypothetical protein
MDKRTLNDAFDTLTPGEAASGRMLKKLQDPPEREMRPLARFAAVTVALCMFAGMGVVLWRYASGDPIFGPAAGGPAADAIHTEFMPYTTEPPVEYSVFTWGENPSVSSYMPTSPVIIKSAEEFEVFSWRLALDAPLLSAVVPSGMLYRNLDYSQKAVVAVWSKESPIARFDTPIVSWGDGSMTVTRRLLPVENQNGGTFELLGRGYFLVVDKEMLSEDIEIYYNAVNIPEEEDVTPDALREATDLRIYKDMQSRESYLVRPGYAAARLGTGFGGWGVTKIEVSEDLSYIVYAYSYGSGIYRSHVRVEHLDESGRVWKSGMYLSKDMRVEPLGGDVWAVYHAEPLFSSYRPLEEKLLAVLTVMPDGVWVDVMHEDGMALAP